MTELSQVDFNKVATVLPINSGAASKRFSRLKAKYAKSSAASNQPDTPATPQNLPSTSASRLPVPSNKRKADAPGSLSDGEVSQSAKKSRVATVKEEDETGDEEADAGKIPRNGAGMRKTRGKTLDFKALLAEDSDDSDNERLAIPATDGAGDCYEDTSGSETSIDDYSDGDWSNEDVSEDEKPKKRGVKKVSGLPTPTKTPSKPALRATRAQDDAAHKQETVINTGVETPPTTPPKNTAGAVRTVPPNTPVGLAGVQMLKTYRATNRAAPSALPRPVKSSSPIVPVKLTNSISSSCVNGETAPEELTDISDDDPVEKKSAASASAYSRESHKVTGDADQLQRELSASLDADDDVEMWEDAVQDFEEDDVLQSIETDPIPGKFCCCCCCHHSVDARF